MFILIISLLLSFLISYVLIMTTTTVDPVYDERVQDVDKAKNPKEGSPFIVNNLCYVANMRLPTYENGFRTVYVTGGFPLKITEVQLTDTVCGSLADDSIGIKYSLNQWQFYVNWLSVFLFSGLLIKLLLPKK